MVPNSFNNLLKSRLGNNSHDAPNVVPRAKKMYGLDNAENTHREPASNNDLKHNLIKAQLDYLLEVGLTEEQILIATGLNTRYISELSEEAYQEAHSVKLYKITSLVNLVTRIQLSFKDEAIPKWLNTKLPILNDKKPFDLIRENKYFELHKLLSGIESSTYI